MDTMMNKILGMTLSLVLFASVVSCSDDDGNDVLKVISTDKAEITFAAEGGSDKLIVQSGHSWVAVVTEPWLMVSPANGNGYAECAVTVDSSLVSGVRTAEVRFTEVGGATASVEVNQTGFGKVVSLKESELTIEASAKMDERFCEAQVTANVPFEVQIEYAEGDEEWLSVEEFDLELDRGARPRTLKLRFDWKMNVYPVERVAKVNFLPVNEDDELDAPATLLINQKAALRIEDNRQGDSLALLTIYERLNSMGDPWDTSENMRNWRDVVLWEASDEDLPAPEAVGRVRSVEFFIFNTEESIPQEIKYLKYIESLSVSSNVNTMLKSIKLGPEVCGLEHLKHLVLFSYGITELPEEFVNLGDKLESLDLSANNFSAVPPMLTKENFPKLKSLNLIGNRRWTTRDLRDAESYENGIGLHFNADTDNSLRRLLTWDTLEELLLSNNFIEGSLPDFTPGEDGVRAYNQEDVDAFGGDTIQYLADNNIPRILPNAKRLSINLNFFTGKLPDWLLYHPHLLDWFPELLVFNQQEQGKNSLGEIVRFENVPTSFEYYYEAMPGTREKYELKEEFAE